MNDKNLLFMTRNEYRDLILKLQKEEDFLVKSCEEKDRFIDYLQERVVQLESAIISGGAIVTGKQIGRAHV